MLLLKVSFALLTVALVICKSLQSSMFDQCGPRHTNLTQECVGKLILETLAKVTEDPENFFGSNVSIYYRRYIDKCRGALCNGYITKCLGTFLWFWNYKKEIISHIKLWSRLNLTYSYHNLFLRNKFFFS